MGIIEHAHSISASIVHNVRLIYTNKHYDDMLTHSRVFLMDTSSMCVMFVYVFHNIVDEKLSSSDFNKNEKKEEKNRENTQTTINIDVNGFHDLAVDGDISVPIYL